MNENYGPFPTSDDIDAKGSCWELRFPSGRTCLVQFSGLEAALVGGVSPESCCYVAKTVWLCTGVVTTNFELLPQVCFDVFQVGDTKSIEARPRPDGGTRQTFEQSHSVGKPVRHKVTGKLGFIMSSRLTGMPTSKCLARDGESYLVCPSLSSIPNSTFTYMVLWSDTALPFSETSTYTAADLEFLDYPAWVSVLAPAQYFAELQAKCAP